MLCNPASAALLLRSINDCPEKYEALKNIIIANGEATEEIKTMAAERKITLYSFEALIEEGMPLPDPELPKVEGSDFCMICYTSGTTGTPKGALFSHINLVSVGAVCRGYIYEMSHFGRNDYYISYLPMAHAFEHFMQTACIAAGMGIGFAGRHTQDRGRLQSAAAVGVRLCAAPAGTHHRQGEGRGGPSQLGGARHVERGVRAQGGCGDGA